MHLKYNLQTGFVAKGVLFALICIFFFFQKNGLKVRKPSRENKIYLLTIAL